MSEYKLSARRLPLNDAWDVIVVGGGPAGCTAAAAAARDGARTLLVEATWALGGMGTGGLVPAWCPFTDRKRIIYGGLAERVLKNTMAGMPHLPPDKFDWVAIDAEQLKRVYDKLMTEHGVTVLFGTLLAGVEMGSNGTVDAILLANKAGLQAYSAATYVDCTGDADLCAWAGAEFIKGDEEGDLQPATHCFVLANVNIEAFRNGGKLTGSMMRRIIESGKYPEIPDLHRCCNVVGPGCVAFNAGHLWDVDNTDPATVSRAMSKGRSMAQAFRNALAEFFPETYGQAHLVTTGALLGIRETRRIIGDYVLTVEDFKACRSFEDEICRNSYFVDVHHKQNQIGTKSEGEASHIQLKDGESHGIPYRCLTPRGLRNMLVAGRSISTDRPTQGSTRVMPVCLAMGEAAGAAAAMASTTFPPDVHGIDVALLQNRLRGYGAYLPR